VRLSRNRSHSHSSYILDDYNDTGRSSAVGSQSQVEHPKGSKYNGVGFVEQWVHRKWRGLEGKSTPSTLSIKSPLWGSLVHVLLIILLFDTIIDSLFTV
jgi:hypothetical protein